MITAGFRLCGTDGLRTFGGFSIERRSGVIVMTNGYNGGTVINTLLFGELLQPAGLALPELANSAMSLPEICLASRGATVDVGGRYGG